MLSTIVSNSLARDDLADARLDAVEQGGGLLDPGAHGRADVERDLAGVDRWEEVAAEQRARRETRQHESQKAGDEDAAVLQGQSEQVAVDFAHAFETRLEPVLEPCEAGSGCERPRRIVASQASWSA